MKTITKQILILFVFSILAAVAMIIHGIYMDLDFSQIKRLSIEGIILTVLIIFPAILFLEWVFDLNNQQELKKINKKISKLKK